METSVTSASAGNDTSTEDSICPPGAIAGQTVNQNAAVTLPEEPTPAPTSRFTDLPAGIRVMVDCLLIASMIRQSSYR